MTGESAPSEVALRADSLNPNNNASYRNPGPRGPSRFDTRRLPPQRPGVKPFSMNVCARDRFSRVQDRYNLSVFAVLFRSLQLPTVPQSQSLAPTATASEAKGRRFESCQAYQYYLGLSFSHSIPNRATSTQMSTRSPFQSRFGCFEVSIEGSVTGSFLPFPPPLPIWQRSSEESLVNSEPLSGILREHPVS